MRQRGQTVLLVAFGAMFCLAGCDTSSSSDSGTTGDVAETTDPGAETAPETAAETAAEPAPEAAAETVAEATEEAVAETTAETAADTPAEVAALSCEAFCPADLETCTGSNQQYADEATCLADCAAWPLGTVNDTTGNTLGCRIWHRALAATSAASAVTHCPHSGPAGGGICTGP